jgi:hypothetical protein
MSEPQVKVQWASEAAGMEGLTTGFSNLVLSINQAKAKPLMFMLVATVQQEDGSLGTALVDWVPDEIGGWRLLYDAQSAFVRVLMEHERQRLAELEAAEAEEQRLMDDIAALTEDKAEEGQDDD